MCGIAGFVDFKCETSFEVLRNMTNALAHRGPDDFGAKIFNLGGSIIGLGHRRLSILDLSINGHQPMSFDNLSIVFNGEIYNFLEIREKLSKKGYSFESDSDTEVILKAYHCWGMDFVSQLNGMFAIAILDLSSRKLILIRDRAGVKPLYLYANEDKIFFASEIKSFHRHPKFHAEIDNESVLEYFAYGYIPNPYSIFRNVSKILPGSIYEINLLNGNKKIHKYWDVVDVYNQPKLNLGWDEALEECERLLKSACEMRMVADVPVGVFLSGGYDSSIVTALLQTGRADRLKTFSIGFDEPRFNEAHHAKAISEFLGTDHTEYYATASDFENIIVNVPKIWDEPIADQSVIPTTLVSQLARKSVTVSLSADGGDETFGGYDKYLNMLKVHQLLKKIPHPNVMALICRSLLPIARASTFGNNGYYRKLAKLCASLKSNSLQGVFTMASSIYLPDELISVAGKGIIERRSSFNEFDRLNPSVDPLNALLAIDYKTYQADNILTKVDRAAMSVGLEGREPLLDYRIIEFVARLDCSFKIKGTIRKRMLKDIAHKYIPETMLNRPKMGFGAPLEFWIKKGSASIIEDLLCSSKIKEAGFYNVNYVTSLRDNFLEGKSCDFQKVWSILNFEMWRKAWA